MIAVQAVYEDDRLRLLEPVNLAQGQRVRVTIIPEADVIRAALGDLVAPADLNDDDAYVENYAEEIEQDFAGSRPLSEIILEERGEQL